MSRPVAAVAALVLAAGLAACSGSSGSGPARVAPAGAGLRAAGTAGTADAGGSASGPGIAASSLTCDQFSASDVQSAVQKQVASATAQAITVSDQGSSDGLTCAYNVATPGTDTSSADRGMAQVMLTVSDIWDQTPITGTDDAAKQKDGYEQERASAQSGNGVTENNATGTYHDISGVGAAAYLVDTVHTDDSGNDAQYTVTVDALRDPRPYRVELGVDYVLPQPDQSLPDKSLDTVMRDPATRAQLAQMITRALLTKVG
jgi:hypothetical protein